MPTTATLSLPNSGPARTHNDLISSGRRLWRCATSPLAWTWRDLPRAGSVERTTDPSTPLHNAIALTRQLANARPLIVPGYGHTTLLNPSTCAGNGHLGVTEKLAASLLPRRQGPRPARPARPARPGRHARVSRPILSQQVS